MGHQQGLSQLKIRTVKKSPFFSIFQNHKSLFPTCQNLQGCLPKDIYHLKTVYQRPAASCHRRGKQNEDVEDHRQTRCPVLMEPRFGIHMRLPHSCAQPGHLQQWWESYAYLYRIATTIFWIWAILQASQTNLYENMFKGITHVTFAHLYKHISCYKIHFKVTKIHLSLSCNGVK